MVNDALRHISTAKINEITFSAKLFIDKYLFLIDFGYVSDLRRN